MLQAQNSGSGSGGKIRDDDAQPGALDKEVSIDKELKDIIVRAATQQQMSGEDWGNLPGGLKFQIDQMLRPKLNWKTLLKRFVARGARNDYNYSKPNRRHWPKYFMPKNEGYKLPPVTVAVDLSASVSDHEIASFCGEIKSIFAKMMPEKIELVEFSDMVTQVTTLKSSNELRNHEFSGRGGTDLEDVMNHVDKNPLSCVIIFTDGFFYMPPKPKVPVLWVIYRNPQFRAPYGKVLHTDGD